MSSPKYDCTACGACCFGGHDRYVALLPEDRHRAIPDSATSLIDGRRYMAMACGHCAQLTIDAAGQTLCAIYADRPEACRAFRAGSFECLKARAHRGPQAAALRALAMAPLPDSAQAITIPSRGAAEPAPPPPAEGFSPSP